VMIAICGPALTGIFISWLTNKQPRRGRRRTFWITFAVAELLALLVFIANNTFINQTPPTTALVIFSFVMVLPVTFIIASANSRVPAVKSYLHSLIRLRGVWGWSLLALITTPVIILITMIIKSLISGMPLVMPRFPSSGWALLGLIVVKLLYQLFFFNATSEEAGWRGFAQPRLQARLSPLISALILALLWAPWHYFVWQAEGSPVHSANYWLEQYYGLIPATFWMVWYYNRSKGSILVAGIMHASANTAFFFINNMDWDIFNIMQVVAMVILILIDRMWKKLPSDHPAVYQRIKAELYTGIQPE
jgi:membrane protease YdiL (CAAX protease family)